MGSFLQQLENNEAVMLMYLAEELPIEDRLEFEQMLAGDAKLRVELEQLRLAQDTVLDRLEKIDKTAPLPLSPGVAIRQVSRLMKQRQIEKLIHAAPPAAKKRRNIPKWAYWTASAAAAMVGIVVWWGLKSDSTTPVEEANATIDQVDEQARLLEMTLRSDNLRNDDDNRRINQVEQDVSLLVSRGASGPSSPSSIFGTTDQAQ